MKFELWGGEIHIFERINLFYRLRLYRTFGPWYIMNSIACTQKWVSERSNLTAFLGTADSEVHIVHRSRVIVACTLESLRKG